MNNPQIYCTVVNYIWEKGLDMYAMGNSRTTFALPQGVTILYVPITAHHGRNPETYLPGDFTFQEESRRVRSGYQKYLPTILVSIKRQCTPMCLVKKYFTLDKNFALLLGLSLAKHVYHICHHLKYCAQHGLMI